MRHRKASVDLADASRFQRIKGAEVDWAPEQRASRPVSEYLVALESENPPINPVAVTDFRN